MKKLMYSAAILLLLGLQARSQTSNLVIFDQQGEPFYAILNGVKENNTPQTNVRITGLAAPAGYNVTILFKDSTIQSVTKSLYLQNPGTEVTTSIIVKGNGEHVLRWASENPLPPVPAATVAPSSTPPPAAVTTTTVVTQQTTTDPNMASVSMNVGGMGTGMNVNVSGMPVQTTVTTTTTSTSSTTDGGMTQAPAPQQSYVDGYSGSTGCPMPMAHNDYEGAKSTIAGKTFENDKLTIAKQIASSNCLTAGQVKGILALFTFEENKLDFAKFAYAHTYDKGNYYKINDVFQFSSSADALNQFINSQH